MRIIETQNAAAAIGPYSQGISIGNFVFTSGQIPVDPATGQIHGNDIAEQADTALRNLAAVLEAGGASLQTVVKTTCFLSDMSNFAAFNDVYARHFGNAKPARSCVAVRELPKGVLVEVEAIAVTESGRF
jgi:2-iminobutanoate/2-iminopropanoate deaminase